jgi:hypothetical protein
VLYSAFFGAQMTHAAESIQDTTALIRLMSGCFRVTFNYVEDGAHDAFYEPVYEKARVVSDDPLTIERILIVEGKEQKHWSEQWSPIQNSVWRQEVTGPFGDFRYACEGEWIKNQWTCTAEHAPKPRRDAARPYRDLTRKNTLQINSKRWVHAQSNTKWTSNLEIYSVELGWNVYDRVDDGPCLVAQKWHSKSEHQ